jgi:transposase
MSLEPRGDDGVPEVTARVVRAAFPKGTLAIRIREALGPLFADEDFAAAFPRSVRPAASPGALALVCVLQFAEGLSGRQAADQVRARMDWKFLLGLELDDPGFDFTILGDFRSRLIRHGLEEQVLEAVLEQLSGGGAAARRRPAADRFHARAGRGPHAEPDGVRRRDAPGGAGSACRGRPRLAFHADRRRLGGPLRRPDRLLPLPQGEGRQGPVALAGRPGRLHAAGRRHRARRPGMAGAGSRGLDPAPGLGPAVPPGRAGGALAGGKDLPPGEQRFASPYDPDARYGVKRGAGWTGYKVHLTEACEPDLPHLILNVETTAATVDDAEMTAAIRQRLAGRRLAPADQPGLLGVRGQGRTQAAQRPDVDLQGVRYHPRPGRQRGPEHPGGRAGRQTKRLPRQRKTGTSPGSSR